MTLQEWIGREGITPTELARRINRPQATVARHVSGDRIPELAIMKEYFEITGGQVTPNDFYDCGAEETERSECAR